MNPTEWRKYLEEEFHRDPQRAIYLWLLRIEDRLDKIESARKLSRADWVKILGMVLGCILATAGIRGF